MSYWKENLLETEVVQVEGKIHWSNYLVSISWAILTITAMLVLSWYGTGSYFVLLAGFGLSAITAVPAWLKARFTEILVTNQRVMIKTGILRRHVVEINLEHLESFEVNQTLLGRIFDFGSIRAIGTGGTTVEMGQVDSPRMIRKIALEAHVAIKHK